jgi:hypothetical protein
MKKNLALFGVLLALLTGTYFFHEKRQQAAFEASLTEGQVFEQEITNLRLMGRELIKTGDQWWLGKSLLSHNLMQQLEKRLRQIRKKRDLTGEPGTYFEDPVVFEVNGQTVRLGNPSLDRQAFYLGVGEQVFLATIEGESTELTTDETAVAETKLTELRELLSRRLSELRETQLFRYYPRLPAQKVAVEAEGNLSFELDLPANTTNPAPIQGISPQSDLRGKFQSLLTQVTLRSEVPLEEQRPSRKLGQVSFMGGAQTVRWELWLKSDKSADALIIDPDQRRAFLMVGGTLKLFFVQLQDYWDKKVIPPANFQNFSVLKVPLVEGPRRAVVEVLNREPLGFRAQGYTVQEEPMQELFRLAFNLGPNDQAERVSQLTKSERQQLLSGAHLRLELLGQEILVWERETEFILVNLTQGFKAHFLRPDKSVSLRFEAVLR